MEKLHCCGVYSSGLLGAEFGWNSWQNDVFIEEYNFEAAKEINMSNFNLRKSWTTWKWNKAFQFMEKKKSFHPVTLFPAFW